jgi:hypothetical protein
LADWPGFVRPTETGLVLHLRVTPNAGRDAIEGAETRDDGSVVLRMRVQAVPDKGKANAAVIALMAKALGVPKSSISLVGGETSRFKSVLLTGPADDLVPRLASLAG